MINLLRIIIGCNNHDNKNHKNKSISKLQRLIMYYCFFKREKMIWESQQREHEREIIKDTAVYYHCEKLAFAFMLVCFWKYDKTVCLIIFALTFGLVGLSLYRLLKVKNIKNHYFISQYKV